jgi:NTP pyrophosphatase (non-canonical NTP hydrolase)
VATEIEEQRMDYNEFQMACRRTAKTETNDEKMAHALEGLISEVGEIADTIKKYKRYGKALDIDNLKEEIGDVDYYLSMLADSIRASRELCAVDNVEKLKRRYPDQFSEAHASARMDKA